MSFSHWLNYIYIQRFSRLSTILEGFFHWVCCNAVWDLLLCKEYMGCCLGIWPKKASFNSSSLNAWKHGRHWSSATLNHSKTPHSAFHVSWFLCNMRLYSAEIKPVFWCSGTEVKPSALLYCTHTLIRLSSEVCQVSMSGFYVILGGQCILEHLLKMFYL